MLAELRLKKDRVHEEAKYVFPLLPLLPPFSLSILLSFSLCVFYINLIIFFLIRLSFHSFYFCQHYL
ncbi:unnamed protein product [Brugia timori]|uniref:Uncharacterized protein n=1 Tax=Brugia timori TaxID=42155 RepID=A0A0R3QF47_9BILA|nr:unnamed protein product [Brugia timori]